MAPTNQGNIDPTKGEGFKAGLSKGKYSSDGVPTAAVQPLEDFGVEEALRETNVRCGGKPPHVEAGHEFPDYEGYGPRGVKQLSAGYQGDEGQGERQTGTGDSKIHQDYQETPGGGKLPPTPQKISSIKGKESVDIQVKGFDDPANLSG